MKAEIKDLDYYVSRVESASFRLKVDLGPAYSAYTFSFSWDALGLSRSPG